MISKNKILECNIRDVALLKTLKYHGYFTPNKKYHGYFTPNKKYHGCFTPNKN